MNVIFWLKAILDEANWQPTVMDENEILRKGIKQVIKDLRNKAVKKGDKVTYLTDYKKEKGIVKSIQDKHHAFVVYNCGEDWENYEDYTGEMTRTKNLIKGWGNENE